MTDTAPTPRPDGQRPADDREQAAPDVLVPWAERELRSGAWPSGTRVHVWDGNGRPELSAEELARIGFWVLPYGKPDATRLLPELPGLRAVQSLSAGVEKLLPALPPGVRLHNGRGLHDASTAEHALGLVLAAQRDLPQWVQDQWDPEAGQGDWAPHYLPGLADHRVALVGYGAIGAALERRLLACEAEVVRVASRARPEQQVHGVHELPDLLPHVDIVVLVLPENASTLGLFGAEQLAALPDGALVVNVGRGRTLDTEALLAEVSTGRLRAALDVTDPEPLPARHPLRSAPGVLLTPHVGGGAASFRPRAEQLVVEQVRRFAAGEELLNAFPAR